MSAGGVGDRYPNGQPVGYSNRNLCGACGGDRGDCNCPPADPALLNELADRLDSRHSFICSLGTCRGCGETVTSAAFTLCGDCAAARLRALAGVLERETKERAEKTVHCHDCGQRMKPMDPSSRYDNV
jgi:hypothetical protein